MEEQKARILVVEDAENHRFMLRNIILEMGCQPVLAESGEQALKVFSRCDPKLVLLDVSMPGMDGLEVCRKMKEDPDMREVPVIFVSGFEYDEEITKVFEVGGEDYIQKPFIPEVVKARVGVHLKLAEAKGQLFQME